MNFSADVLIGIPSGDTWSSDFGMCLVGLVTDFSSPLIGFKKQSLILDKKEGTLLPTLRQGIVEKAIEKGCNYVLFVDTDQTFPPSALRRLLSHGKMVVACNIPIKRFPSLPTARAYEEGNPAGRVLYSKKSSPYLERVWRVGTGLMLIDLSVFKRIEKPWFPVIWKEKEGAYQGEDWGFCEKIEAAGIPIFVDHYLSLQVEHVGKVRYSHSMCLEEEELCTK